MGTTKEVLEKLKGLDASKLLAVVDLFGSRENLEACLRGEKEIALKDASRSLVDHTGRLIPAHLGITCAVCDENRDFHIQQPEINYAKILAHYVEFFPEGIRFPTASEFEDKAEASMKSLLKNKLISNLVKRVHIPLPLPYQVITNYGVCMQYFFLPVLELAYKKHFPARKFVNRPNDKLLGKISILPNMGQDRLISGMAKGPGMAWYFPNSMQGFSVLAQRQAMGMLLQNGLTLAGAIEPALGFIGYSKELASDENTPGYECSAVSFDPSLESFFFWALSDGLVFECYEFGCMRTAHDYYSGGLVFIG